MLKIFFILFFACTLFTEAEPLTCISPGASYDSDLVNYHVIPGKKGAKGLKGLKGKQYSSEEVDNLESKKVLSF